VGAGVMGAGVAQSLAQAGLAVILQDLTDEILARARGEIQKGLRFQQMFKKVEGAEKPAEVLSRIAFTTDVAALAPADFVIENATEKIEIKERIYRQLDAVCREEAIFAANTAEMIRGYHTTEETLRIATDLLAKMGKDAIVVNDSPGFVSNRVLMLTVNEAIFLVHEGVAPAEDVDRLFKSCFGHKMGPLETADLIGLDTILYSIVGLYEQLADGKFRPCPLLTKMVDAGLLGRKSGKGFYDYSAGLG